MSTAAPLHPLEHRHPNDPRPDLDAVAHDAARWAPLLAATYRMDFEEPDGVYALLHGLRAAGAVLLLRPSGKWRLAPGPDFLGDWEAVKAESLVPFQDVLVPVMDAVATEAAGPAPAAPATPDAGRTGRR